MTELGMVLSNPLHGPRLKGCVGQPLPGVRVRIVDEAEQVVLESDELGRIVERMKGGNGISSGGGDCSSGTVANSATAGSGTASSGTAGSADDGTPGVGELRVKSAGVFNRYLHRPDATAESFDQVTHPYINIHAELTSIKMHTENVTLFFFPYPNRYPILTCPYLGHNRNLVLTRHFIVSGWLV